MTNDFGQILDECIDRISQGETIKECLADHPEQAEQLEPLLQMMTQTKEAYTFTPSDDAKRAARQNLYAAIDKQNASFWQRWFTRRLVLATAISVIALIIIGYVGLRSTVLSPGLSTYVVNAPDPEGNFAFLVTDDVNAISDFNNLNLTVDKVNLLQQDSPNKWIEFTPETKQFDLAILSNGTTKQLWQGNIPDGQYSDEVIYVSKVDGVLKSNGETIEIKLPSNKIRITKPFEVNSTNTTSFVYDLTVVKAGNAQNGGKYLLKPQVNTSRASQTPKPVHEQTHEKPKESPKR